MKRTATTLLVLLVASVASVTLTSRADAALRVPQVPVLGGSLQAYLNSVGESINVNTDQDATQTWSHTTSGTTTHTLMLETNNVGANTFGLYNGGDPAPALFAIIHAPRVPGSFSTATFQPGNLLKVNHFDENAIPMGSVTFGGVDPTNFGFYLQVPNGVFYTQDGRNPGGLAQALAYRGTGPNTGTWWLCWEDVARAAGGGSDHDFDDTVVLMESVNPTPVSKTSWGSLKARFR